MYIDNILKILYEDKDIIVFVKPAGIEAQTSRYFEKDVESILKNYFSNKQEETYVGLIHRLDKTVSGIMLVGKNKKATNTLNTAFINREITKKYLSIVCGKLVDKCGKLENFLYQDKKLRKSFVVSPDKAEAKKAILTYKVLGEYNLSELKKIDIDFDNNISLLEIKLETGRFHQIRAQLANLGNYIIGDRKYSDNIENNLRILEFLGEKNILLASYILEFKHPITKKLMSFEEKPEWDILKKL